MEIARTKHDSENKAIPKKMLFVDISHRVVCVVFLNN